jgi:hypothetical protein
MGNWYDEEEVVKVLRIYLTEKGYKIRPKWGKQGPDIEAEIEAEGKRKTLIVEAKGYPTTYYARGEKSGQSKPTQPQTQARHWVADAIFSITLRMADDKSENTHFALAFPQFKIYLDFMQRLKEVIRQKLNITVFTINEGNAVREFLPEEDIS